MDDEKPNEEDEAYFQRTADGFQDQFKGIVNKYQLLMMKESMVSVSDFFISIAVLFFVSFFCMRVLCHMICKSRSVVHFAYPLSFCFSPTYPKLLAGQILCLVSFSILF